MSHTATETGKTQENIVNTKSVWNWWQEALEGRIGPMHEGQPEQGYYRARFKGGQWQPVAIWKEDGEWKGMRSERMVPDVGELWNFCRTNPVTYEAYTNAVEGKGWDDEPPIATIGDNSGAEDPIDQIMQELAGEKEMAEGFLKSEVKTQADADKAGIWAKRLADLSKRADNFRVEEKEPHLTASKGVDDKWRGPVGEAKDLSVALKRHVEPFLIAQKRAEEARAAAAAAEAARLRREAEEAAHAARQAEEANTDQSSEDQAKAEAHRAELMRQAQEAERAAEVKNASAGRTGAKVSIRSEKRARVTDYYAAAKAMLDMNHSDLKSTIDQLAQRAVKAGVTLAGVEVENVEKVA